MAAVSLAGEYLADDEPLDPASMAGECLADDKPLADEFLGGELLAGEPISKVKALDYCLAWFVVVFFFDVLAFLSRHAGFSL